MKINNQQMFSEMPRAVIFDTDNTLYAYDPAHEAGMSAVLAKASSMLKVKEQVFLDAYERARQTVKARLKGTASSHSRLLYFQTLLESIGLRTQVMLALDFEQTYWRAFLQHAVLFDGVRDLLDDLRIAGVPTAIVTDLNAHIQFRKLIYFDLDGYFDHIVTSEEAGADKPSREAFELIQAKLNIESDQVWMLGDSYQCDIQGARTSLNAVTLQKKHAGVDLGLPDAPADLIFEDFRELRVLLNRLASAAHKV